MAQKYDIVSRSRDFTVLSVIVGYENKAGKPALKKVEARVPFHVRRDCKRDYALAETYLSAGLLENVKAIDAVKRYVTINYTMPFSDFQKLATATEKESTRHQNEKEN